MESLTVQSLPPELLHRVCEALDNTHRPSVKSLALVSHRFHTAATTVLFRQIHLDVSGRIRLQADTKKWLDTLQRTFSHKHVRQLRISGYMPCEQDDKGGLERPEWQLTDENYYGHDEIFGEQEDEVFCSDQSAQLVHEQDGAWKPLAALIQQLPALADLIWECMVQFPPCILDILHQGLLLRRHLPVCRLHITSFRFRSLNSPEIDPHEIALARSPCLHSISVRHVSPGRDSAAKDDFNEEAVWQTVADLAPNLQEVRMFRCRPASSAALSRSYARATPRPPWRRFPVDQNHQAMRRPASLSRLEFNGYGSILQRDWETWSKLTDLSQLHCLKLQNDAIGSLHWAVENCTFLSLTTLELDLTLMDGTTYQKRNSHDVQSAASAFICKLRPLSTIKLTGTPGSSIVDIVLEYHGRTLRSLRLDRLQPTSFMVDQLRTSCPLLEDLALTINRQRGNPDEKNTYKALGKISKLRNLFLYLDCSIASCHVDYAADALINTAVDESLALAIFLTISDAKPKGALPLQEVKLYTTSRNIGQFNNIGKIYGHVGRSWVVERNPRDDSAHKPIARELGRRAREAREAKYPIILDGPTMAILGEAWPECQDGKADWQDVWRSSPLQEIC